MLDDVIKPRDQHVYEWLDELFIYFTRKNKQIKIWQNMYEQSRQIVTKS